MSEQVTKDQSYTPRTDATESAWELHGHQWVRADFARQLERELTETLRSLIREQNARKNAVSEHDRIKAQLREYQSAHANLLLKVKDCPNCDAGANHE